MDFEFSERSNQYQDKLLAFMDEHIYPAEGVYAAQMAESANPNFHPPILEELKTEARKRGLWTMQRTGVRGGEQRMIKRFFAEEEGQTLVEYGLLISLIALVVIAVLTVMGRRISNTFGAASNQMRN